MNCTCPKDPFLLNPYCPSHGNAAMPWLLPESAPKWDADKWITAEQLEKWLAGLTASKTSVAQQIQVQLADKLPPDTYLEWQAGQDPEIKPLPEIHGFPVDTGGKPLTSENPATAECRVYWNSHGCDKPRIHVLPGHPDGPEHVCDYGNLFGPCSKITVEGYRQDWDDVTGDWEEVGPVKPYGEDWEGQA